MRHECSERGEKMTLTHAAISGECKRRTLIRLDRCDTVEPLRHKLGGAVREVVSGYGLGRIGREIPQALMGADFDNVFYFFLNGFHLSWLASWKLVIERCPRVPSRHNVIRFGPK